jgi:hypothetical protein
VRHSWNILFYEFSFSYCECRWIFSLSICHHYEFNSNKLYFLNNCSFCNFRILQNKQNNFVVEYCLLLFVSFIYFCLGWCRHLYFNNYNFLWRRNCKWTLQIFKSQQHCFSGLRVTGNNFNSRFGSIFLLIAGFFIVGVFILGCYFQSKQN